MDGKYYGRWWIYRYVLVEICRIMRYTIDSLDLVAGAVKLIDVKSASHYSKNAKPKYYNIFLVVEIGGGYTCYRLLN